MIILDANVLLYAYSSESPQHASCKTWLAAALSGTEQIGLPWQTLLAFVRIATHPKVFNHPITMDRAATIVNSWLARPQVVELNPGGNFWRTLQQQLRVAQVRGPLVTDAALAAMVLEQGGILCTTDRDFRRFDGLKILDPTATRT